MKKLIFLFFIFGCAHEPITLDTGCAHTSQHSAVYKISDLVKAECGCFANPIKDFAYTCQRMYGDKTVLYGHRATFKCRPCGRKRIAP